jgi:hypothetical protein
MALASVSIADKDQGFVHITTLITASASAQTPIHSATTAIVPKATSPTPVIASLMAASLWDMEKVLEPTPFIYEIASLKNWDFTPEVCCAAPKLLAYLSQKSKM